MEFTKQSWILQIWNDEEPEWQEHIRNTQKEYCKEETCDGLMHSNSDCVRRRRTMMCLCHEIPGSGELSFFAELLFSAKEQLAVETVTRRERIPVWYAYFHWGPSSIIQKTAGGRKLIHAHMNPSFYSGQSPQLTFAIDLIESGICQNQPFDSGLIQQQQSDSVESFCERFCGNNISILQNQHFFLHI